MQSGLPIGRATLTGLEPATSAVTGRRANHLRYRAKLGETAAVCTTIFRFSNSSPTWNRTKNLPINSRTLCQLSYRGIDTACPLRDSNSDPSGPKPDASSDWAKRA